MIKPTSRPDYTFWMTPWSQREKLSNEEYNEIMVKLEEYSLTRFSLGKRFRLTKRYNIVPAGTGCTVISVWPKTAVRWDKWSQTGVGSTRRTVSNVLFDLDISLSYLC